MDLTISSFIKSLPAGPPLYTLSPPEARKFLDDLQDNYSYNYEVDIVDLKFSDFSVRIYRPLDIENLLPGVIYYHGGGWVLGDAWTHDRLIRELVIGSGLIFIFIKYTLAPEAQFPTQLEQGSEVIEFITTSGSDYGIDTSQLAIAGDSVGGNMATVTAMMYPYFKAQLLFYPVTDLSFNTRSYQQFAEGPWLTRKAMEWFADNYGPSDRESVFVSPLNASTDQMSLLPPTLIITAENDVLRDEGEAYAHKLMQAGVDVTSLRCLGAIHDFMMLNGIAESNPTRLAIFTACEFLKAIF